MRKIHHTQRPSHARSPTLLDVVITAPHVLDRILDDHYTWRGLRNTSRHFKHAVDARMYRHIVIKAIRSRPATAVNINPPKEWCLAGIRPQEYALAGPVCVRLIGAPVAPSSDPIWAPLLAHTHIVDLDLGPFGASPALLRPHLRPHTLRLRTSSRGLWVRKPLTPLSAHRVVLFPNSDGWGFGRQAMVVTACRKVVVNVLISLNGACLFPRVNPFDSGISEVVMIFTLFTSNTIGPHPDMQGKWGPLLQALLKRAAGPTRPIIMVGLPNVDFMPLLRGRGKPGTTPPSSVALFREVLRRRGADLSLFRFLSREEYAQTIGRREFELETCWSE